MSRQPWDKTHERHVYWSEKGFAVVVFAVGMWMMLAHHDASKMWLAIGAGLAGVGIWGALPSVRPLLSSLIDRIPILSKRNAHDITPPPEDDK